MYAAYNREMGIQGAPISSNQRAMPGQPYVNRG